MGDLGGIGLHLSSNHVLGVGEVLNDPLRVIVEDAVEDDLLKVGHGQTGTEHYIGQGRLVSEVWCLHSERGLGL